MALLALLAVQAEEVSIRLMLSLVVRKLFTTIAEQIFKCPQHLDLLLLQEAYLYLCMYLCILICVFLFVYLCICFCVIVFVYLYLFICICVFIFLYLY